MLYRVALSAAVMAACVPVAAAAADALPPIKVSRANTVPECVTPGRLTAFLKSRNPALEPDHERLAVAYMRHGEALGLRWDYAFFQMVVETGYLTFKRDGGKRGDVRASQNNFAGLGATGRGARGESFPDVSTGVLAHLQHVLMYTGAKLADPVAERTRKVMEWRVLDEWRETIAGPMTYAHLAEKWAANDSYAEAIRTHAERFRSGFCAGPDPAPEMVAEARKGRLGGTETAATGPIPSSETPPAASQPTGARPPPPLSGRELAQRAIEEARAAGDRKRSSLGALPRPAATIGEGETSPRTDTADQEEADAATPSLLKAAAAVGDLLKSMTGRPPAAPPAATKQPAPPATAGKQSCRVWTASYGGGKAMLIKAPTSEGVSYTVLDVNEGREQREAEAYIAAYAKGGSVTQIFPSQAQALEKAFTICPEG